MVITGEEDPLCEEAEAFALRLIRAGVEVTARRFPGEGHAFFDFPKAYHVFPKFTNQTM